MAKSGIYITDVPLFAAPLFADKGNAKDKSKAAKSTECRHGSRGNQFGNNRSAQTQTRARIAADRRRTQAPLGNRQIPDNLFISIMDCGKPARPKAAKTKQKFTFCKIFQHASAVAVAAFELFAGSLVACCHNVLQANGTEPLAMPQQRPHQFCGSLGCHKSNQKMLRLQGRPAYGQLPGATVCSESHLATWPLRRHT